MGDDRHVDGVRDRGIFERQRCSEADELAQCDRGANCVTIVWLLTLTSDTRYNRRAVQRTNPNQAATAKRATQRNPHSIMLKSSVCLIISQISSIVSLTVKRLT